MQDEVPFWEGAVVSASAARRFVNRIMSVGNLRVAGQGTSLLIAASSSSPSSPPTTTKSTKDDKKTVSVDTLVNGFHSAGG